MPWLNVPNTITLLRIALAQVFLVYAVREDWRVAVPLFILAGFSDLVDGALARLLRQRTELGTVLDPTADKLLMSYGFITLAVSGWIPLWLTVIVIGRDLMICGGVFFFRIRKIPVKYRPIPSSKITTFAQLITLTLPLFQAAYGISPPLGGAERWAAAFMTVYSGVQYYRQGWQILRAAKKERS